MIDAFRPWVGMALGVMLMIVGFRWFRRPETFVGVHLFPAIDPRIARTLGVGMFILGALNVLFHFSDLVSA